MQLALELRYKLRSDTFKNAVTCETTIAWHGSGRGGKYLVTALKLKYVTLIQVTFYTCTHCISTEKSVCYAYVFMHLFCLFFSATNHR